MPDYTKNFQDFIKSKTVGELKKALSNCDNDWKIKIVDYGYRTCEFNILDVDVSYSDGLMQIQLNEIVELEATHA